MRWTGAGLLVLLGLAQPSWAQEAAPTPTITLRCRALPLPEVLRELERQSAYTFVYSTDQLDPKRPLPALTLRHVPLADVLHQLLPPLGLDYRIVGQQIILSKHPATTSAPATVALRRTVQGRVTAQDTGQPLPGAGVQVAGTTRGVAASVEGQFILPLLATDTALVVSSLGYTSRRIRLPADSPLTVVLRADTSRLHEVVVTGFGLEQERRSLGYAVQTLAGSQLTVVREPNFINAGSGLLAGVQISRSGSGPMGSTNIIIRGYTSLTRDSRPLVVVDGVPIDNRNALQATRFGGYDSGDGLTAINPDDIETVSVLKGGNAAALYGNRAANGALIITTKKGHRGLGLTISSNTTFDWAQVLTDYQNEYGQGTQGRFLSDAAGRPLLTPDGYPQLAEALETIGSWGPRMGGQLVRHWNGEVKPFLPQPHNPHNFFRLGATTATTAALSAGTARTTVRLSVADLRNRGTYPNSRLRRNYVTLRGTVMLTPRLSLDLKACYLQAAAFNRPTLGANPDNVMSQFQRMPRSVDLADLLPYRDPLTLQPVLWNQNRGSGLRATTRQNPYWAAYLNTNESDQDRGNGSVALRYDFTDWLWLQLRFGTDRYITRIAARYASYTAWNATALPDRGGLSESRLTMREDNADFILNATRGLGPHWKLTGQGFGNLLHKRSITTGSTGQGLLVPNVFTLDNTASRTPISSYARFEVQSLYGRAQLSYRDAVFLELTGRNDWDSTLPRGNWSYFYPSASVAVAYSELLGHRPAWLTLGKLRASWARVGKGASPYELTTQYDLTTSGVPGAPGIGNGYLGQPFASLQDQLAAGQLKPQITRAVELGSELRLAQDRAGLDLTVYRTNTYNQVTSVEVSAASGFRSQLLNAGDIQNQGLEVVASAVPCRSARGLRWELALNWATNRSRVLSLTQGAADLYQLGSESNNVAVVAQVGRPFGDLYGTRLQRAPDGRLLVDADGLPLAPATTTARLGNFQPNWFGGLYNAFSYRSLSLGVLLDARWGGQVYSVSQQQATLFGNARQTLEGRAGWYASEAAREAAGVSPVAWTPTGGLLVEGAVRNPDGTYSLSRRYVNPQAYWARLSTVSEPFVYDATFVKLRELTLTYRLPAARLASLRWLRGASLALVGRNLCFLKRGPVGFDPESAYNLSRAQGLESGAYPNSRTLGYHLVLEF